MEPRLAEILRRLGQAEAASQRNGEERQPFLLIYAAGGSVGIKHPAWDSSWPNPVAEDIDDLEELGYVRNQPAGNAKRVFSLSVKGRRQAEVLSEPERRYSGGQAPNLDGVIAWLVELDAQSPEALAAPGDLPSQAVQAGLIDEVSREALASRVVDLVSQGFLTGELPDLDQASAETRLSLSGGLRLTMKAHERTEREPPSAGSLHFYGSVVAGQIAAGDIANYVNFGQLLDRAESEIKSLADVSDSDRDGALGLVEVLRGKASLAGAQVLTGAGGGLLAGVLAQLLGLPQMG
jgi:hypothetical protein